MRPYQNVVAETGGKPTGRSDDRVLHHDAMRTDLNRPSMSDNNRTEKDSAVLSDGHVTADGGVGGDVG